ncbi:MAG TPA: outer membrane lipoprotein-sorting protein [Terriglobales bacterium]|jgi:hypothetical protein|nr:outer membrane lipoprotein-sorting protein [Terriglobales bacterium]
MKTSRRYVCLMVSGWVALASLQSAFAAASDPAQDVETIVSRMERAEIASRSQQPYTLTRSYQFFDNNSQTPTSQVVAKVEFQPPGTKNFAIQKAQGSGQGEKIVRQVLEHERAAAQDEGSQEISRRNYDFKFLRTEQLQGSSCYVLQLIPKRQEKNMIRGQAWVDATTYLIRRIDGELAKNPSWWVKDVHVTLEFGSLAGLWLQTAMQAIAYVRIFGERTLQAQSLDCTPAANLQTTASRAPKPVDGLATQIASPHYANNSIPLSAIRLTSHKN